MMRYTTLQTIRITEECRNNRGDFGAYQTAVEILLTAYTISIERELAKGVVDQEYVLTLSVKK